jgi:hypothetical protein
MTWQPPDEYPYSDTAPGRCFLWHHTKVRVRTVIIAGTMVERYDCRCRKWYWLSGPLRLGPQRLTRFRNR